MTCHEVRSVLKRPFDLAALNKFKSWGFVANSVVKFLADGETQKKEKFDKCACWDFLLRKMQNFNDCQYGHKC